MTLTVVAEYEIVAILRRCKVCGEYKPRDHFELYVDLPNGGHYWTRASRDHHLCAQCRGWTYRGKSPAS